MTPDSTQEPDSSNTRFLRVRGDGAMLGGVCAGLARSAGLDVTLVRVLTGLSILLFGAGLLVYVILWVVMPLEGDA